MLLDEGRNVQAWNWWIKGLGGLIQIGEQLFAKFGKPVKSNELSDDFIRLAKIAGVRFTITNDFVITDHEKNMISRNGGKTWIGAGS